MFIHSSVDGLLGCFCLLAVVDNIAMKMGVQIPLLVPAFSSQGYMPTIGIAGSQGNSILNSLRDSLPRPDFKVHFPLGLKVGILI